MAEIRRLAPSQAAEYKSKQILRPSARPAQQWLLDTSGPLAGHAMVHLVDKNYFVVGKVIDLLVEEVAHAAGVDLYVGRRARDLARALHGDGARALGKQRWDQLLAAFNSVMRIKQRNSAKATVDEFFAVVDDARLRSTRRNVEEILAVVWAARPHAQDFQRLLTERPDSALALDPLFASLPQTVRAWHERTRRPIRVVHDRQDALTPGRTAELIAQLRNPPLEFRRFAPPTPLVDVVQVASESDPRVQVADLVAGIAQQVAGSELEGHADSRTKSLRPFVQADSLWADETSWAALTGEVARRP